MLKKQMEKIFLKKNWNKKLMSKKKKIQNKKFRKKLNKYNKML